MRRGTLFWGLILILAGVLFLLENLGIINVDIWGILWPIFLIALGISLLWGVFFRRSVAGGHAEVSLDEAQRARVRVRHGAGRLEITAGAPLGVLLEGTFGGGLDVDRRQEGDLLQVTLSVPSSVVPFFGWPSEGLDWRFGLTRDIPLSLELDTGANESRIDLTELNVKELSLRSGASSTELILPAQAGLTRASIETGAAAVRVHIPAGVAASIRSRSGLSSINVDSMRFPRQGDLYLSPDFETADNRVELNIQAGVGSVDVF